MPKEILNKIAKGRVDIMESTKNIYANIYTDTSRRMNGIWHVIFLWKGSVFKLMWHDILVFTVAYALLAVLYRTVLFQFPVAREVFEMVCIYAGKFSALIPISFLTGFYVSQVVTRWWDQFMSLPWPDQIALRLVSYCPGKDQFRKNLRRTVMRYVNLSTILVYRLVSTKVKSRFPTYKEMVEAKLILPHEVERLLKADSKTPHESTWTPILWAVKLIQRARSEGKIQMEPAVFANLVSSIDGVESSNRKILNYGWINFPLAYTQVATLSVFCYFMAAVFGRQYLIPREVNLDRESFPHLNISYSNTEPFDNHTPDFYFPVFTYVELLSYMGWIKVAETLLNPFGDDDEDFQVNYMIDRNLQVSYLIVDEAEEEMDMAEDPFMEAGIAIPKDLPGYVNKSSKAPIKSGDSLDLVHVDGQNSTAGGGAGRLIFHRFRSLRLRKKQQDMLSAPGAAKSLDMRHEGPIISIDEGAVSKSAPPTTTPKPSSAFLLKRMQAEEESVGLSMEEVVRLSQNKIYNSDDREDENGPQLSSLNSLPEQNNAKRL